MVAFCSSRKYNGKKMNGLKWVIPSSVANLNLLLHYILKGGYFVAVRQKRLASTPPNHAA